MKTVPSLDLLKQRALSNLSLLITLAFVLLVEVCFFDEAPPAQVRPQPIRQANLYVPEEKPSIEITP